MMKRIIGFLNSLEEFLLWSVLLQMVLLSFFQVVLRYGFNSAFTWAEELLRFEVVFITFISAGLCVKYGFHIGVDLVSQVAPPRVRRILESSAKALTSMICFFLCYLTLLAIMQVRSSGFVSPALGIPKYIPYIPICMGCLIIAVRSALQFWSLLAGASDQIEAPSNRV